MIKISALVLMTGLLTLGVGTNFSIAAPNASDSQLIAQNQTKKVRRVRGMGGQERMMEQLNLSAQQKQDIDAIRQKFQGQTKPLQEQLRKQMEELRTMMDGAATSESIRTKHSQVMALRQQLGNLRFEGMLESRDVLTVEQRKQFAQLMQQNHSKMKNNMGQMGGNGGPME
ncbi:MAG: Spy/CpxP family protein refolding chaperone [Microcystaceae cyanobacterium]